MILGIVAAIGASAAASAPAAQFEQVATIGGPGLETADFVVADGVRYVAFKASPTALRVRDEAHGGRSFTTRLPAACSTAYNTLVDAGGGQVAIQCEGPNAEPFRPYLLVVESRTWREAAGTDALVMALRHATFSEVGAQWIRADLYDGPSTWLNWHTGERRPDGGTATEVPDPDLPELMRPLCAPLRRALPLVPGRVDFQPYRYQWPFGTTGRTAPDPGLGFISIQRCGDPQPIVFDSHSGGPGLLGGGVMTWMEGTEHVRRGLLLGIAHAHLARCRATLSWSLGGLQQVVHAGRAVYVVERTRSGRSEERMRRLMLPPGCPAGTGLTVMTRHGRVSATAVGGTWTLPTLAGAEVALHPVAGSRPSAVKLRGDELITLGLEVPARGVLWRVDGRRWRAARKLDANPTAWRLSPRNLGAGARLTVEVRPRAGGSMRFVMRVRGA